MVSPNTVLLITIIASFATPFTLSAVNVALPDMASDLHLGALAMGWVSLSFLLASGMFLVPAGRAADIYGRKKAFTAGFAVFTAASLACAMASSATWLIAFRTLQGIGSAMIFGTGVAILTSVFPAARRGRALGYVSAAVYSGLSMGPLLGGFLVGHFSWRAIFYLNVPVGMVVLFLVFTRLDGEWKEAAGESFDKAGALLYSLSTALFMFGLSTVPAPSSFLMLAGGAAGFAYFLGYERRVTYPVFNSALLMENRVFAYSSLTAFLSYSSTFAVGFMLSLYLQYARGLTPQQAGLTLVWQPAFMVLLSPWAGRLSDRLDPGTVSSVGMGLTCAGVLFFTGISETTPFGVIIGGLCVLGTGLAFFSSPNTNAVMGSVEKKSYSVASATLATMRLAGQTFSMALVLLLFSVFIGSVKLSRDNIAPFIKCFNAAVYVFAAMSFAGIFTSLKRRNNPAAN